MELIKNLISQLEAAADDPVVKLLIISVIALIVFIIINLLKKIIKQLFSAIAKPFKKKRKARANEKLSPPKFQQENIHFIKNDTDNEANDKVCLQEAHAALQKIQTKLTELNSISSQFNLPNPISITESKQSFSEETLLNLEYTENSDEITKQIIESIKGKGAEELENELALIIISNSSVETTLNATKNAYLNLISERKTLLNSQTQAVNEFNKELINVEEQVSSFETSKQSLALNIESHKKVLLELVDTVNAAETALADAIKETIEKTALAKNFINSIKPLKFHSEEYEKTLTDKKLIIEKIKADIKANDAEFASLTTDISANNKTIAENRIKSEILTATIERIKEEEKRLAEEKAKAEAEAREARIREEARKLEEEHRLEEERRQEQARLEAEQAEMLRIQQEKQKEEELLKAQQQQASAPEVAEIPYMAQEEPLTEEQEAEQARAMMEAQRARRRHSANTPAVSQPETPSNHSQPIDNSEKESKPNANNESLVEKENNEREIVKEVTQQKEKVPQPQSTPQSHVEDPMAKIKAEWEREHNIQAALEAGDVDAAINLANKKNN